jgi:intracellular septation protein
MNAISVISGTKNMNKPFFILSFLPALAYWALEEFTRVEIAVAGGMALAIIEMGLEYYFYKKIHSISKLNFFLILLLGSASLFFREGILFKLQPFFTGIVMGPIFIFKNSKKESYMLDLMREMGQKIPDQLVIKLERDMGYFLIIYSSFMAYVAFKLSTSAWLFYKTAGFYIAFALFTALEMVMLRMKIKKEFNDAQIAQSRKK